MITNEQLSNWFSYHAPATTANVETREGFIPPQEAYERIREAGLVFATVVRDLTPSSADQTAAIRKIREAVFTANAAIACEGK